MKRFFMFFLSLYVAIFCISFFGGCGKDENHNPENDTLSIMFTSPIAGDTIMTRLNINVVVHYNDSVRDAPTYVYFDMDPVSYERYDSAAPFSFSFVDVSRWSSGRYTIDAKAVWSDTSIADSVYFYIPPKDTISLIFVSPIAGDTIDTRLDVDLEVQFNSSLRSAPLYVHFLINPVAYERVDSISPYSFSIVDISLFPSERYTLDAEAVWSDTSVVDSVYFYIVNQ